MPGNEQKRLHEYNARDDRNQNNIKPNRYIFSKTYIRFPRVVLFDEFDKILDSTHRLFLNI